MATSCAPKIFAKGQTARACVRCGTRVGFSSEMYGPYILLRLYTQMYGVFY